MAINVAHVTLSMGTGGIENLILNICKGINKKKINVLVICLDFGGELLSELEKNGIRCIVEQRKPGIDWRLVLRLATLFKKMQVDVVHAHNQACAFYAGLASFWVGVPLVVTEHSRHYIDSKLIRRIEKKVLSFFCYKWVTVSNELAEISITREFVNPKKIKIIINGIDFRRFESSNNNHTISQYKNKLSINESSPVVIMVARLAPIKNHAMMINALSILKKIFPDILLLIVGDGECRETLVQQAYDLHLLDNINFLGTRFDIPELLALSDVFVLCSYSEGLPLSLLEASAASVPIVITTASNSAGFIRNKENGTVVSGDITSLAAGIKKNLLDKRYAAKMANRANMDVLNQCSLLSTIHQYEDLYLAALY